MKHAVIMAGGTGSRLWPLSRRSMPKQFQRLIGDRSLLQQTFDRINKVLPAENIWVQTLSDYNSMVLEQLPELNPKHIISEPAARGTAPATGLATLTVLKEDPDAILFGLLPADHYVGKEEVFSQVTERIFNFLEENPKYIATIGIQPTEANTGLGYIKKGQSLNWPGEPSIFEVDSFLEKPNYERAKQFVESGNYLWNGGYYLFNGAQILEYYQELLPETFKLLSQFVEHPDKKSLYQEIVPDSFDTAISERTKHLAVIPAMMEWSDVGNWAAIHDILAAKGESNQIVIGEHVSHNSDGTLIMGGGKLIATVGLKDIVVIDTEDALLICHKDNAQNVKKIVEDLESQGKKEYL